jgi:hypothetical protein
MASSLNGEWRKELEKEMKQKGDETRIERERERECS